MTSLPSLSAPRGLRRFDAPRADLPVRWLLALGAAIGAVVIGFLTSQFATVALALALTPLLIIALSVEPWVLVGTAVATPWLARVVTTSGIAPKAFDFADFGITIVALTAAVMSWLARDRESTIEHKRILQAIGGMAAAITISAVVNVTAVERLVVGLLLTLEPFFLIAAIIIAPPSLGARRILWRLMAVICVIQVPIAIRQSLSSSDPDVVKGTLFEAGAGHHVMAGGLIVGLFAAIGVMKSRIAMAAIAVVVLVIGALADAKQVMLVAPVAFVGAAILIATRNNDAVSRRRVGQALLFTVAVALVLFTLAPVDTTIDTLNRTRDTGGGKPALTVALANDLASSPLQGAFGFGPGETVSRFGYLTTILESSSVAARQVGLGPGKLTRFYDDVVSSSGFVADSSFSSGQSSLLGVAGDYGFLGLTALSVLGWRIGTTLRRIGTRLAQSALAAWLMVIPLGYVFDWLEQPPFMLMIALLTGLALTDTQARDGGPELFEATSRPFREQVATNLALIVALVALSIGSAAFAASTAPEVEQAIARIRTADAEPVPGFLTSAERTGGLQVGSRILQLEDVSRSQAFRERRDRIVDRNPNVDHSLTVLVEPGYVEIDVRGDAESVAGLAQQYRTAFLDVFHSLRQASVADQLAKVDELQAELDASTVGTSPEAADASERRFTALEQIRTDLFLFQANEAASVIADGVPVQQVAPGRGLARSLFAAGLIGAMWALGFVAVRSLLVDKVVTRDEIVALSPEGTPVQQTTTPVAPHNPEIQILALRVATACQPRHRGANHMVIVDAPSVSTAEGEELCRVLEMTVGARDPLLGLRFGLIPEADEELVGTVIAVKAGHLDGPAVADAISTARRTGLNVLGVLLYPSVQAASGTHRKRRKQGANA